MFYCHEGACGFVFIFIQIQFIDSIQAVS